MNIGELHSTKKVAREVGVFSLKNLSFFKTTVKQLRINRKNED